MNTESILQIADSQDDFLERMSALHQERLQQSILALEKRIVDRVSALDTSTSGNLIGLKTNLAQSQKIHSDMTQIFDEEYGAAVRTSIAEYQRSLPRIQAYYKEMGEAVDFTGVDKDMIDALKTQDLAAYAQFGQAAQEKIATAMYNSVVAQAPFSSLVASITGVLIGHKDALGRPLSNYAKQMANDGIMNFHNSVMMKKAEDLKFDTFLYYGNIIRDSRPFCIQRAGNVYTKAQIQGWTFPWKGKSGPAMSHRGGYNCRHHWQPVRKGWLPEGGIEVQSAFDRVGVMPVSQLSEAIRNAPKFKAYQAWQRSVLVDKNPLTAIQVAAAAGTKKTPTAEWMSRWRKGMDLPDGWQSVVRDLEAEAGGFVRTVPGPPLPVSTPTATVGRILDSDIVTTRLQALESNNWHEGRKVSVLEAAELGRTNPLAGKVGDDYYTKVLGHSESDYKDIKRLLTEHGLHKEIQEVADKEIKTLLLEQSPKGELMRDIMATETRLLRAVSDGHVMRMDIEIAKLKKDLLQNKKLGILSPDIEEQINDQIAEYEAKKNRPPMLYRKGALRPGEVEPWTLSSKGAQTSHIGKESYIVPDKQKTIKEMLDEGYQSIGGIGRMTGAPGESEVTMIRLLPEDKVVAGIKEATKLSPKEFLEHPLFKELKELDFSDLGKHPVWGKVNQAGAADEVMERLANIAGYDGLPQLVPAKEFTATKGLEIARGIAASTADKTKQYVDDFLQGKYFAGKGVWGNGTYTAYGDTRLKVASEYADLKNDGRVLEMKLRPEARVVGSRELRNMEDDFIREFSGRGELEKFRESVFDMPKGEAKDLAKEKYVIMLREVEALEGKLKVVVQDPGRLALLLGYDAIDVARNEYMVVLNRSMLVIKEG